jgi:hypothetical protein
MFLSERELDLDPGSKLEIFRVIFRRLKEKNMVCSKMEIFSSKKGQHYLARLMALHGPC